MKRQSLVLLAVAFVAAGAAGCFKDPVSSLRGGPATMVLDAQSIYVAAGDSVNVQAQVKDNSGNVLAETDAVWSTGSAAVAVVRKDTTTEPGNFETRGIIRGVVTTGGVTNVTVTSRGVTGTVRVVVTPPTLAGTQVSVKGTASADTVVVPGSLGPPPTPPDTVAYTAGDTLVIDGTSVLQFDTSQATAYISGPAGVTPGIIVSKTPTELQVAFLAGAAGKVIVTHLLMVTGNAAVGNIVIDSLIGDSVAMARQRFGALQVSMSPNNAKLGDTITVTAPAGLAISPTSKVVLGNRGIATSDTMWVVGRTASTISGFAKRGGTGTVTLTNVLWGAVPIASISSANPVAIDSIASDFSAHGTQATAATMTIPAANVDTVYGTISPTGNANDFWTFTTTAAHIITPSLAWFGDGNPYTSGAPDAGKLAATVDLDMMVCSVAAGCDENSGADFAHDLMAGAAAVANMPETGSTPSEAAGQYWVAVLTSTLGNYSVGYRLIVKLQ